ncbi:MAG TPA: hypothetical protein VHP83_01580 [Aggregatilineaceae bacterium]|nr:hypothetical protein [Aggregatilineaceae bacterium]
MWRIICVVAVFLVLVPPVLAQGGDELTETFTFPGGGFSFSHPAGWVCTDVDPSMPDLVTCFSSQETYDAQTSDEMPPLDPGEMGFSFNGPSFLVFFEAMGLPQPTSAEEVLAVFAVDDESSGTTYSETEAITVGEWSGLQAQFTQTVGDGVMVALDMDGKLVILYAMTASGEFEDHADLIDAMIASVAYGEPEGDLTFTSEDGRLQVTYEAGLYIDDLWTGELLIADQRATYETVLSREAVPSGSFLIQIHTPESDYFGDWLEDDAVGADAVEQVLTQFLHNYLEKTLSDPVAVTVGEYEGVRVDYTTPVHDGYVLALDQNGARIIVLVSTAPGELVDHEELITKILEFLQYTPLE